MIPALTNKETIDRLAVLVSGEGVMKLLGAPKLSNGTGISQATAVFQLINDWNLTESIQFMSFDTTASNTGLKGGACTLLEQKLNRTLVSLACRHHILELIVASVFDKLIGVSSGPNIQLFLRFSKSWNQLNKDVYESGVKDKVAACRLEPIKTGLVTFIRGQLRECHPREDYKELLQLSLLFLGETLENYSIHSPGAFHRARCMAKLIYSLKIYLFQSQFNLTARELSGLLEFNLFVVQLYLKSWFTAPAAALAPKMDLELLQNLVAYKTTNAPVANAAIKSFSGHLWYLNEILVGLAFFNETVTVEMKVDMVASLHKQGEDPVLRRIKICEKQIKDIKLSNFVTNNTKKLFVALHVSDTFLQADPSTWEEDVEFIKAKQSVKNLKVVNDAAERGISLIQSFNGVLTNQEEQMQYLLQIVEKRRQQYPNANKQTIVQGMRKK